MLRPAIICSMASPISSGAINRTRKTKGCLNRKTALAMVYRLMMSAKKKWRKISGPNRLPEVIQGVEFKDGIRQLQTAA